MSRRACRAVHILASGEGSRNLESGEKLRRAMMGCISRRNNRDMRHARGQGKVELALESQAS